MNKRHARGVTDTSIFFFSIGKYITRIQERIVIKSCNELQHKILSPIKTSETGITVTHSKNASEPTK